MVTVPRLASAACLCAAFCAPLVVAGCAGTPTRPGVGQQTEDSLITSKVKEALVVDRSVAPLDLAVETFKGTVQLSGFANSQTEISRAVELASDVKGVRSVKNEIRLKPTH